MSAMLAAGGYSDHCSYSNLESIITQKITFHLTRLFKQDFRSFLIDHQGFEIVNRFMMKVGPS